MKVFEINFNGICLIAEVKWINLTNVHMNHALSTEHVLILDSQMDMETNYNWKMKICMDVISSVMEIVHV